MVSRSRGVFADIFFFSDLQVIRKSQFTFSIFQFGKMGVDRQNNLYSQREQGSGGQGRQTVPLKTILCKKKIQIR